MTAIMTTAGPSAAPPPINCPCGQAVTPRRDYIELGPFPEAIPAARRHVRAVLAGWGLRELAADAESVTAELAGNAVAAHEREHRGAPVGLTLLASPHSVLITVRDASSDPPVPGLPGDDAEHGRGLLLVEALCAGWDWKPAPGGGKVVRALVTG